MALGLRVGPPGSAGIEARRGTAPPTGIRAWAPESGGRDPGARLDRSWVGMAARLLAGHWRS